jgi:MFS superfamily sulfate permease-like transporter
MVLMCPSSLLASRAGRHWYLQEQDLTPIKPSEFKTNLLSGLTVSPALVPEATAFALVAQVSPMTGMNDLTVQIAVDARRIAGKTRQQSR